MVACSIRFGQRYLIYLKSIGVQRTHHQSSAQVPQNLVTPLFTGRSQTVASQTNSSRETAASATAVYVHQPNAAELITGLLE